MQESLSYDTDNRLTQLSATGPTHKISNPLNNTYVYGYNPIGWTTAVTSTVSGVLVTQTITHDALGCLSGLKTSGTSVPQVWLRTARGIDDVVTSLHDNVGKALVYDLTVAHDHTFFIGRAQVLVHSDNGSNCDSTSPSRRLQYLGRTPGKGKKTGRSVIARMIDEGSIRETPDGALEAHFPETGKWSPLNETNMGHIYDAVTWWNQHQVWL